MATTTTHQDSTVTIEGEIPTEAFEKHRPNAVKHLGKHIKIDGFREGHIPEKILVDRIGEYAILEEMAERTLTEHYPQLLIEHKIDAIGRPDVSVTKLAAGNPLGFKIKTAVIPQFTLPDYTAIAHGVNEAAKGATVSVEEKEVDAVITELLKEKQKADQAPTDAPLPEMTDELAKTFGPFETTDALRAAIKEGITKDKERVVSEKRRNDIIEGLVAKTSIPLPAVLIDAEVNKMFAQFLYDIERFGMKKDEYLAAIKKTEDDLRKDFRPDAEKRAKSQLILNDIARAENLLPAKEEVEKEVAHILSHHEAHEGHDEESERQSATLYVTTILTNKKVLEFLESR